MIAPTQARYLRQVGWDVFINGKKIDTAYFTSDCDAEHVRQSLINHDGYDPRIEVLRAKQP